MDLDTTTRTVRRPASNMVDESIMASTNGAIAVDVVPAVGGDKDKNLFNVPLLEVRLTRAAAAAAAGAAAAGADDDDNDNEVEEG